jgi:hypothetical protein
LFGLVNTSLMHEQHVEPITCEHVFEHTIATIPVCTTDLDQHTNLLREYIVQILYIRIQMFNSYNNFFTYHTTCHTYIHQVEVGGLS